MYSDLVYEHFAKPRNVGVIENADGQARVESTVHNDLIELYIRVEGDRLADIKYRVHGCAAAIASSSITSELAMGKTLDDAAAITPEEVAEALHGLPENKVQCSVLAPEALRQAIQNYRERVSAAKANQQ
ncbi:MAG: iron-sulfur cluster assembly scaffold protein [Chloroflexi bacterium]|jgi:nitrogen fixation NifU-like protein|nr:iron-sulfur cluster assembly scaffold protein [Chloroflexota bacterium]